MNKPIQTCTLLAAAVALAATTGCVKKETKETVVRDQPVIHERERVIEREPVTTQSQEDVYIQKHEHREAP